MIVSEGNVFGEKYYTVKPIATWDLDGDWGGIDTWNEMENWCINTFGCAPANGVWEPHGRWYMNNSKFWFKEQKDLEWFLLKWQ
jgi:hypothetical protein